VYERELILAQSRRFFYFYKIRVKAYVFMIHPIVNSVVSISRNNVV